MPFEVFGMQSNMVKISSEIVLTGLRSVTPHTPLEHVGDPSGVVLNHSEEVYGIEP